MTDTRVVLVKPGDVLIFGNVGVTAVVDEAGNDTGISDALATIRDSLNLAHILLFEADIDLAAVPSGKGA